MVGLRFRDRFEAGRRLGEALAALVTLFEAGPVVLGLARGGLEVAAEVARVLPGSELDVLVVRKLGHPSQPELGLGAIAEGGEPVFDPAGLSRVGLSTADLAEVVAAERAETARRVQAYRRGRAAATVTGRIVVIVDDGIATGVTARAALRSVRARAASRLVLAAPVAASSAVAQLRGDADEIVVLATPRRFASVSQWYERFDQTTDADVVRLLADRTP